MHSIDTIKRWAAASGLSVHAIRSYLVPSTRRAHRWASAEAAQLLEETTKGEIKAGEICPACAGCKHYNKTP